MSDIVRKSYSTRPDWEYGQRYKPDDWPEEKDYLEIYYVEDEDKWYARTESDGGSSRSTSYDTEDEAEAYIMEHIRFRRAFWDRYVESANNGDKTTPDKLLGNKGGDQVVRVNGHHYVVGQTPSQRDIEMNRQGGGLGHGGRQFKIRMNDGREITTINLWAQGKIPPEYREILPDNAVFL